MQTPLPDSDGASRSNDDRHNFDQEQIELTNSREFWTMIAERRQGPTIPWDQIKREQANLD
jgi:hypothetical protein